MKDIHGNEGKAGEIRITVDEHGGWEWAPGDESVPNSPNHKEGGDMSFIEKLEGLIKAWESEVSMLQRTSCDDTTTIECVERLGEAAGIYRAKSDLQAFVEEYKRTH